MQKFFFQLLIGLPILTSIFLTSGCGPSDQANAEEAVPDSFIFARGADAQKLDPADVDDGESVNTMAQVFEGLLAFKEGSLEVEPRLAESFEISEAGLTYTFKIRPGIQFHDGTPLNAETARFSFERQLNPEHPAHFANSSFQYWSNLFSDIQSVEATDSMTLVFKLKQPNASLIYSFASFPAWLISPGAFDQFGEQMIFHPVGTGPYRFVSWRPNEAVVFERNDEYWRKDHLAGFERLVIRSIPLNTTRLSELKAGRIHGLDGVQPSELSDLQENPAFTIHHDPGLNVGYLAFSNLRDGLKSPEVRRAIWMAIDREALVRLALDGYGQVADYPLPPGFLGAPGGDGPVQYDPEEARKILAGHPEILGDTIRLATFGQPRMYFPDPQRIASLIRSDLEEVGLRVNIVNREFKSHLHQTRQGEFDMALLGWMADTPDPDNFLSTFFHSKAAVKGSATNISFYKNEEMDRLLDQALRVNDTTRRTELYAQALGLWERDLPLIPLVHGEQIVVMRAEIEGYELHPSGNHFFGPAYWATESAAGGE